MSNIIEDKSFRFAVRIVKLSQYLTNQKHEYVLSKQVLKSGTSIGANIYEAQQAHSKADFAAKMSISLKEAAETKYWLRLLTETGYLTEIQSSSILEECTEIEKLLYNIVRTSKDNK